MILKNLSTFQIQDCRIVKIPNTLLCDWPLQLGLVLQHVYASHDIGLSSTVSLGLCKILIASSTGSFVWDCHDLAFQLAIIYNKAIIWDFCTPTVNVSLERGQFFMYGSCQTTKGFIFILFYLIHANSFHSTLKCNIL